MHFRMTRAEIRRMISPTPIGLTPGFLYKGISLQALYGRRTSSFTFQFLIFEQMKPGCDTD